MITRVAGVCAALVVIGASAAAGVAHANPSACDTISKQPNNAGVWVAALNLLGNGVDLKAAGQILSGMVAEQCPEYSDLVSWWDAHANGCGSAEFWCAVPPNTEHPLP